jgi:GNAT superfamily N-acetyltransferase
MLRNAPIPPRVWRELLEDDDVASIASDGGEMLLTLQDGQLNLHYAFAELEGMRREFVPIFDDLKGEIDSFDADYVRIDLVQIPDRTWVEPLLEETDFQPFTEWMDMEAPELDAEMDPPDFPDGVAMRRGGPEDAGAIVEIEAAALDELGDGEAAMRARVEGSAWVGVLERDGKPIAYALNDEVSRAEGRVSSSAVHPDEWGNGFGVLVLSAALYQLAANEARRATVRVRPEITAALRTTREAGLKPGPRGIEWRRPVDEDVIAERRQSLRLRGVKARFGGWR